MRVQVSLCSCTVVDIPSVVSSIFVMQCRPLRLAFEAEPGTTWHLSTRDPISIRSLVQKICDRCGVDFSDVVEDTQDRLGKDQSYLLDSTSIRERFAWTDHYGLQQGLDDTLGGSIIISIIFNLFLGIINTNHEDSCYWRQWL